MTIAWLAQRAHQQADRALAKITRQRAELEAKLREAETRPLPSLEKSTSAQRATPRLTPLMNDGDRALQEIRDHYARRNDPEWQWLKLDAIRAGLFSEFAAFYRQQFLSPDRIAALENEIAEHRTELMDLEAAARVKQLTSADPAIEALRAREQERFDAAVAAVLGPAGARAFAGFADSEPERSVATRLAEVLAVSPEPLSANQAGQLVKLLKSNREVSSFDPAERVINWTEVKSAAATFLSPAQLEELGSCFAIPQREEQIRELIAHYVQWAKSTGVSK